MSGEHDTQPYDKDSYKPQESGEITHVSPVIRDMGETQDASSTKPRKYVQEIYPAQSQGSERIQAPQENPIDELKAAGYAVYVLRLKNGQETYTLEDVGGQTPPNSTLSLEYKNGQWSVHASSAQESTVSSPLGRNGVKALVGRSHDAIGFDPTEKNEKGKYVLEKKAPRGTTFSLSIHGLVSLVFVVPDKYQGVEEKYIPKEKKIVNEWVEATPAPDPVQPHVGRSPINGGEVIVIGVKNKENPPIIASVRNPKSSPPRFRK